MPEATTLRLWHLQVKLLTDQDVSHDTNPPVPPCSYKPFWECCGDVISEAIWFVLHKVMILSVCYNLPAQT